MIAYRPDEIRGIRASGAITASILQKLAGFIRVGLSTGALDAKARELLRAYPNATAAFLGYRGYPAVLCTSVNDVVVHGIPSDTVVLRDGDLVGIDFGAVHEGWYADAALTVPVGSPSAKARELLRAAEEALAAALAIVRPGVRIGDLGATIQAKVEAHGFGVVRDLVGHGVGRALHEDPKIPNVGVRGDGEILVPGAVLAIEPMITAGSWEVVTDPDGWTVRTVDHSLAAHMEHTIVVTKRGCEVLTRI